MSDRRALVVGSAPCVFEDLERAPDWPLIVINYAGTRHLGPIDMWVSLHFRLLVDQIEKRAQAGGDMDFQAFTRVPRETKYLKSSTGIILQQASTKEVGNGSSGLLAVLTALDHGYDRLVLCGVPLEGSETIQAGGRIEKRQNWKRDAANFERFRKAWVVNREKLAPHVRSMSGWTKELLGGVEEWL